MFLHIMLYLLRAAVITIVIIGSIQLWVKQPQLNRMIEKRREARRVERARWAESEAWLHRQVLEQREWFDRAYDKIPAPWRAQHRAF